jgi:hypothetical protein
VNPSLAQRVLRFLQPRSEQSRLEFRMALAQARAEAEDLTLTLENCCHLKKKKNGDGRK